MYLAEIGFWSLKWPVFCLFKKKPFLTCCDLSKDDINMQRFIILTDFTKLHFCLKKRCIFPFFSTLNVEGWDISNSSYQISAANYILSYNLTSLKELSNFKNGINTIFTSNNPLSLVKNNKS